jgi:hypothetical protein
LQQESLLAAMREFIGLGLAVDDRIQVLIGDRATAAAIELRALLDRKRQRMRACRVSYWNSPREYHRRVFFRSAI